MQSEQSQALFSGPTDRVRRNGHELKHRLLSVNIRRAFISVRITRQCHRLPREVVKIFKSFLDMVLGSTWPCLSRVGGPDNLQKVFPT